MTKFISDDLLAMTIIKIKSSIFGIDYTTLNEFNYVRNELQKEFNKEDKETIIYSDFISFNADDVNINSNVITLADNPLINRISESCLSNYLYIIAELIMEYAEQELERKKEKFEKFKSENNAFDEKQKSLRCLLKK